MSDSLRPHGLQHARFPCPLPSSRACSNSCPLSQWCHLKISSSAALSFWLQPFPASGSLPMSWLFTSGGQNIRVSASACPSNEYSGLISFRIDWFDLLAIQGTHKSLLLYTLVATNKPRSWSCFLIYINPHWKQPELLEEKKKDILVLRLGHKKFKKEHLVWYENNEALN